MKRTSFGRAAASTSHAFVLRATVAALAGAGLISAATVGAQEISPAAAADKAEPSDTQTVVVTGVKASLIKSLAIQSGRTQMFRKLTASP